MFIFRGSFRTFRCSCSHRVLTYRAPKHRAHTCCSHIEVFLWLCGGIFVLVFLWWCSCSGVVVFLRWWCGGVFVVVWWCFCCGGVVVFLWWCCGPRTRTFFRCVNIRPESSYLSLFCKIVVVFLVFLWCCFWCFCGGGVVVSTSGPRTCTFRRSARSHIQSSHIECSHRVLT